ncbi:MAG: hypothetical protein M3P32_08870 [Chloroflexota bacterium]|nr:hypothetical protein [Chloroflexota bacterium]
MLLDPLEHEIAERLAAAGDRARSSASAPPDRAFSAGLRDRLMAAASDRAAVPDRTRDRESRVHVAWSLGSFLRVPRLLPVAVASLLLIAGVVAARELYVAIGNRPEATPLPSVAALLPSESAGEPSLAPLDPSTAPSADATPAQTPAPTVKPTVKPTAQPTAVPTPAPTPGLVPMSLTASGCDGGIVLEWSQYDGDFFNHYTTLRNTTNSIPKAYPPQGGAVDPGETYATHIGKTSAADSGVAGGTTYYYRTMAFDADDGVIGASSVMSAVAGPVASLGLLGVGPDINPSDTLLTWTPYAGSADCFTWYKLVYSQSNPFPSYLDGDPYLAAISSQGTASYTAASGELSPGPTYFRVQAIRATDLGLFVVAESTVTTYNVP